MHVLFRQRKKAFKFHVMVNVRAHYFSTQNLEIYGDDQGDPFIRNSKNISNYSF